ncbi:flagellar filament capping protein FliD [Halomonas sp. CnH100-B]|uniref:flagellar filament capping protein FliD n=1 Tax=Halomonas sp. CnH100-B TaxID=2954490 RepID=UPI0020974D29|nr:flagellar filament capping protein FliD [Halomonas sp. CnH100-B]MCO7229522.1 flagellar filament capping protein FliD [Halomonas sp. CnH100-B]
MATITSLGVGSGLDLNGLLTQLQASERQKLTPLTQQQNTQQTKISAYGRLQSAMDRLQESITALNDTSTFRQQTSTVTGEGVSANAGETANAGRYDINVIQLAKGGSVASNSVAMDQVLTTAATTLTIDFGATYTNGSFDAGAAPLSSYSLDIAADSTLEDVRDQINADAESGVTASIVNDGTGYRLALSSKETGKEASVVGFSGLDQLTMDSATLRPGQDAELEVNGIAITGTTNRIEGAIQGVTLDISAVSESPVSLVIERDEASLKETIEEFVSTYNEVRSTIDRMTAFNGEGETAGELLGDRTVRTIENRIRRDITDSLGNGDLNRLAQIGIDIDERGRLQIDETTLDEAIATNVEGLTSFFAGETEEGGFAGRLNTTLESITADDGIIQVSVDSAERRIENLDERIARTELSIERNIERYRSQFAQLDGMIAQMNSTGAYLAQQFSMLSAMQSNN